MLIIAIIIVAIICLVDTSVFFMNERTEDLLYNDGCTAGESSKISKSDTSIEREEIDKSKSEAHQVKDTGVELEDDFIMDDVDVSSIAQGLVDDVWEDANGGK